MKQLSFRFYNDPARRVAFHEAGHVVVGYIFGLRLRRVSIVPDEDCSGITLWRKRYVAATPEAIINMAGTTAEKVLGVTPRSYRQYGDSDINNVIELHGEERSTRFDKPVLSKMVRTGLRYFELRAEQLVRENWKAVAFIANELMREGTMKGPEVERILRVLVPQVS